MSKLYFRYGTENCGKSAALMFSAYNYKEIKKRVFLIKPFDNSKYGDKISSKIGLESKVSLLVSDNYNFSNCFRYWEENIDCIFVDDAHLLTPSQVEDLWYFSKNIDVNIPIFCYGLRTDSNNCPFPGSVRLFELADVREEVNSSILYDTANLYFRYGTMNCGKSAFLMFTAFHCENDDNKNVYIIKPGADSKGGEKIVSRVGLERKVDLVLPDTGVVSDYYDYWNNNYDCLFVDEAQFLTPQQVQDFYYFTEMYHKPVVCYGLATQFDSRFFIGTGELFNRATIIEKISSTICSCGEEANVNARYNKNGVMVLTGDRIVIDDENSNVEYRAICGKCYSKKMKGRFR